MKLKLLIIGLVMLLSLTVVCAEENAIKKIQDFQKDPSLANFQSIPESQRKADHLLQNIANKKQPVTEQHVTLLPANEKGIFLDKLRNNYYYDSGDLRYLQMIPKQDRSNIDLFNIDEKVTPQHVELLPKVEQIIYLHLEAAALEKDTREPEKRLKMYRERAEPFISTVTIQDIKSKAKGEDQNQYFSKLVILRTYFQGKEGSLLIHKHKPLVQAFLRAGTGIEKLETLDAEQIEIIPMLGIGTSSQEIALFERGYRVPMYIKNKGVLLSTTTPRDARVIALVKGGFRYVLKDTASIVHDSSNVDHILEFTEKKDKTFVSAFDFVTVEQQGKTVKTPRFYVKDLAIPKTGEIKIDSYGLSYKKGEGKITINYFGEQIKEIYINDGWLSFDVEQYSYRISLPEKGQTSFFLGKRSSAYFLTTESPVVFETVDKPTNDRKYIKKASLNKNGFIRSLTAIDIFGSGRKELQKTFLLSQTEDPIYHIYHFQHAKIDVALRYDQTSDKDTDVVSLESKSPTLVHFGAGIKGKEYVKDFGTYRKVIGDALLARILAGDEHKVKDKSTAEKATDYFGAAKDALGSAGTILQAKLNRYSLGKVKLDKSIQILMESRRQNIVLINNPPPHERYYNELKRKGHDVDIDAMKEKHSEQDLKVWVRSDFDLNIDWKHENRKVTSYNMNNADLAFGFNADKKVDTDIGIRPAGDSSLVTKEYIPYRQGGKEKVFENVQKYKAVHYSDWSTDFPVFKPAQEVKEGKYKIAEKINRKYSLFLRSLEDKDVQLIDSVNHGTRKVAMGSAAGDKKIDIRVHLTNTKLRCIGNICAAGGTYEFKIEGPYVIEFTKLRARMTDINGWIKVNRPGTTFETTIVKGTAEIGKVIQIRKARGEKTKALVDISGVAAEVSSPVDLNVDFDLSKLTLDFYANQAQSAEIYNVKLLDKEIPLEDFFVSGNFDFEQDFFKMGVGGKITTDKPVPIDKNVQKYLKEYSDLAAELKGTYNWDVQIRQPPAGLLEIKTRLRGGDPTALHISNFAFDMKDYGEGVYEAFNTLGDEFEVAMLKGPAGETSGAFSVPKANVNFEMSFKQTDGKFDPTGTAIVQLKDVRVKLPAVMNINNEMEKVEGKVVAKLFRDQKGDITVTLKGNKLEFKSIIGEKSYDVNLDSRLKFVEGVKIDKKQAKKLHDQFEASLNLAARSRVLGKFYKIGVPKAVFTSDGKFKEARVDVYVERDAVTEVGSATKMQGAISSMLKKHPNGVLRVLSSGEVEYKTEDDKVILKGSADVLADFMDGFNKGDIKIIDLKLKKNELKRASDFLSTETKKSIEVSLEEISLSYQRVGEKYLKVKTGPTPSVEIWKVESSGTPKRLGILSISPLDLGIPIGNEKEKIYRIKGPSAFQLVSPKSDYSVDLKDAYLRVKDGKVEFGGIDKIKAWAAFDNDEFYLNLVRPQRPVLGAKPTDISLQGDIIISEPRQNLFGGKIFHPHRIKIDLAVVAAAMNKDLNQLKQEIKNNPGLLEQYVKSHTLKMRLSGDQNDPFIIKVDLEPTKTKVDVKDVRHGILSTEKIAGKRIPLPYKGYPLGTMNLAMYYPASFTEKLMGDDNLVTQAVKFVPWVIHEPVTQAIQHTVGTKNIDPIAAAFLVNRMDVQKNIQKEQSEKAQKKEDKSYFKIMKTTGGKKYASLTPQQRKIFKENWKQLASLTGDSRFYQASLRGALNTQLQGNDERIFRSLYERQLFGPSMNEKQKKEYQKLLDQKIKKSMTSSAARNRFWKIYHERNPGVIKYVGGR